MSASETSSAILQYITTNAYPDSESISSASLDLTHLSNELHKQQQAVKAEICTLSRTSAPDIDTWISRAKTLQKDILSSRTTAREIVEQAEAARNLRQEAEEKGRKVRLLEEEVGFNAQLRGHLEGVGEVRELVRRGREDVKHGRLREGLGRLREVEGKVAMLGGGEEGVGGVLRARVRGLRDLLREAVRVGWEEFVRVDVEGRRAIVKRDEAVDGLIETAKGLGEYEGAVKKLVKDFERAVVKPRMTIGRDGRVGRIQVEGSKIRCHPESEDADTNALFEDLKKIVDWLRTTLPSEIADSLWENLSPSLVSQLEETWLDAAVPLEITDMPAFQQVLSDVASFADQLESFNGAGSKPLRDWVQSAPRTWLTKRRETVLGDVRNLVFTGLRETQIVERVETQMVSKEDELVNADDDEWDTAWDEPEDEAAPTTPHREQESAKPEEDDDEASAWGADFDEDDAPQESTKEAEPNEEDDAWGWGDGEEPPAQTPSTPKKSNPKPEPKPNGTKPIEREMTLRETFTTTSIPTSLLSLLKTIITDAQTLAEPQHSTSPIAPAATGLYTLPTLALAIYRATAPTAYGKLPVGNMLIYNDASRLAEQLKAWQDSQPPASRLRLNADVTALEGFAKRAYGAEMEAQRTILRDLLDGAQGFSNSAQSPFKQECESAVEGAVGRLRDVHKQWTGILSDSALLQSIGSLLSTVTGKMIAEILDLPDIGADDSTALKALCDSVGVVAKEIFTMKAAAGGNSGNDGDAREERDMTFVYCPNWLKFQYLGEILEGSLADIKFLWTEGELSLEFGKEEVVGLIEALFAESERRRGVIQDVRRGGRG